MSYNERLKTTFKRHSGDSWMVCNLLDIQKMPMTSQHLPTLTSVTDDSKSSRNILHILPDCMAHNKPVVDANLCNMSIGELVSQKYELRRTLECMSDSQDAEDSQEKVSQDEKEDANNNISSMNTILDDKDLKNVYDSIVKSSTGKNHLHFDDMPSCDEDSCDVHETVDENLVTIPKYDDISSYDEDSCSGLNSAIIPSNVPVGNDDKTPVTNFSLHHSASCLTVSMSSDCSVITLTADEDDDTQESIQNPVTVQNIVKPVFGPNQCEPCQTFSSQLGSKCDSKCPSDQIYNSLKSYPSSSVSQCKFDENCNCLISSLSDVVITGTKLPERSSICSVKESIFINLLESDTDYEHSESKKEIVDIHSAVGAVSVNYQSNGNKICSELCNEQQEDKQNSLNNVFHFDSSRQESSYSESINRTLQQNTDRCENTRQMSQQSIDQSKDIAKTLQLNNVHREKDALQQCNNHSDKNADNLSQQINCSKSNNERQNVSQLSQQSNDASFVLMSIWPEQEQSDIDSSVMNTSVHCFDPVIVQSDVPWVSPNTRLNTPVLESLDDSTIFKESCANVSSSDYFKLLNCANDANSKLLNLEQKSSIVMRQSSDWSAVDSLQSSEKAPTNIVSPGKFDDALHGLSEFNDTSSNSSEKHFTDGLFSSLQSSNLQKTQTANCADTNNVQAVSIGGSEVDTYLLGLPITDTESTEPSRSVLLSELCQEAISTCKKSAEKCDLSLSENIRETLTALNEPCLIQQINKNCSDIPVSTADYDMEKMSFDTPDSYKSVNTSVECNAKNCDAATVLNDRCYKNCSEIPMVSLGEPRERLEERMLPVVALELLSPESLKGANRVRTLPPPEIYKDSPNSLCFGQQHKSKETPVDNKASPFHVDSPEKCNNSKKSKTNPLCEVRNKITYTVDEHRKFGNVLCKSSAIPVSSCTKKKKKSKKRLPPCFVTLCRLAVNTGKRKSFNVRHFSFLFIECPLVKRLHRKHYKQMNSSDVRRLSHTSIAANQPSPVKLKTLSASLKKPPASKINNPNAVSGESSIIVRDVVAKHESINSVHFVEFSSINQQSMISAKSEVVCNKLSAANENKLQVNCEKQQMLNCSNASGTMQSVVEKPFCANKPSAYKILVPRDKGKLPSSHESRVKSHGASVSNPSESSKRDALSHLLSNQHFSKRDASSHLPSNQHISKHHSISTTNSAASKSAFSKNFTSNKSSSKSLDASQTISARHAAVEKSSPIKQPHVSHRSSSSDHSALNKVALSKDASFRHASVTKHAEHSMQSEKLKHDLSYRLTLAKHISSQLSRSKHNSFDQSTSDKHLSKQSSSTVHALEPQCKVQRKADTATFCKKLSKSNFDSRVKSASSTAGGITPQNQSLSGVLHRSTKSNNDAQHHKSMPSSEGKSFSGQLHTGRTIVSSSTKERSIQSISSSTAANRTTARDQVCSISVSAQLEKKKIDAVGVSLAGSEKGHRPLMSSNNRINFICGTSTSSTRLSASQTDTDPTSTTTRIRGPSSFDVIRHDTSLSVNRSRMLSSSSATSTRPSESFIRNRASAASASQSSSAWQLKSWDRSEAAGSNLFNQKRENRGCGTLPTIKYIEPSSVRDLFVCRNWCAWEQQPMQPDQLSNSHRYQLFCERKHEAPRFANYRFRRATADEVRRVFGANRMTGQDSMEIEDVPFTAKDVPDFEVKRAMVAQLDDAMID